MKMDMLIPGMIILALECLIPWRALLLPVKLALLWFCEKRYRWTILLAFDFLKFWILEIEDLDFWYLFVANMIPVVKVCFFYTEELPGTKSEAPISRRYLVLYFISSLILPYSISNQIGIPERLSLGLTLILSCVHLSLYIHVNLIKKICMFAYIISISAIFATSTHPADLLVLVYIMINFGSHFVLFEENPFTNSTFYCAWIALITPLVYYAIPENIWSWGIVYVTVTIILLLDL